MKCVRIDARPTVNVAPVPPLSRSRDTLRSCRNSRGGVRSGRGVVDQAEQVGGAGPKRRRRPCLRTTLRYREVDGYRGWGASRSGSTRDDVTNSRNGAGRALQRLPCELQAAALEVGYGRLRA